MSATTEAYDLFSYESCKVNETSRTTSIAEEATTEADILLLHSTRRRAVASEFTDDTQFHGPSYLFHHWCLSLEEMWSWKHAFLIVILMAALASYIHWCYPVPC